MADGPGRVPTSRAPLDLQQSTWAVPVSSAHSTTPNISAPTRTGDRLARRGSEFYSRPAQSARIRIEDGHTPAVEKLSRWSRPRAHHTHHAPGAMRPTTPQPPMTRPQAAVQNPSTSLHAVADIASCAPRESRTRVFLHLSVAPCWLSQCVSQACAPRLPPSRTSSTSPPPPLSLPPARACTSTMPRALSTSARVGRVRVTAG